MTISRFIQPNTCTTCIMSVKVLLWTNKQTGEQTNNSPHATVKTCQTFNNSPKCYTYCRCRIWLSFTLGRDLGIALWWWLSITWVAWFLGSLYFPLVPGIDWRWWGWHKLDRILSVHRWEWTLGLILTLLPTRENFLGVVGFFTVFSGSTMGRTYNITIIYNSNFL